MGCGPPAANPIPLDKCYGPDTPEGQPGAPPMKASQDPEIQPVLPCSMQSCGGITWLVNFALPVPAATDGWVVQEIMYSVDVTGPGATAVQDHYWEGFWFPAGSTGHVCVNALSDDSYGRGPSKSGTTGTATWIGKAKFYEGTLPGDFMRDAEPLKSPAGVLRYTRTQPAFWDGTGTAHDLTITWDCSDPGNPVDSVQSSVPPDDCLKP
jgi:hypothetical protein